MENDGKYFKNRIKKKTYTRKIWSCERFVDPYEHHVQTVSLDRMIRKQRDFRVMVLIGEGPL